MYCGFPALLVIIIIIINNFKAWANWSVPRQLSSQLVIFSPFFIALEQWVASLLPLHNFCSILIRPI
jgi:hypothetical protein